MSNDKSALIVKKSLEEGQAILEPIGELAPKVYDDLLSGPLKQVSELLNNGIFIFASPLLYARKRVEKLIESSISAVKEENRVAPPLPILISSIQHATNYEESDILYKMFQNLLTKSFDSEQQGEVHPSFVWIISQLSQDEAKILHNIYNGEILNVFRKKIHKESDLSEEIISEKHKEDKYDIINLGPFETLKLHNKKSIKIKNNEDFKDENLKTILVSSSFNKIIINKKIEIAYIQHLQNISLLDIGFNASLEIPFLQRYLVNKETDEIEMLIEFFNAKLTDFGRLFMKNVSIKKEDWDW